MNSFKKITEWFNRNLNSKPLTTILVIALIIRLIAAFYAKGYGMHDDHFSIIEAAQSWVDGTDYDNWLPKSQANPEPVGHSFFYSGIQYYTLTILKAVGISNPDTKMLLIRILHALFSLVTVWAGYKIAFKYGGQKNATQVGLLLGLLWFMPFLSVRNLIEIVAIPFMMLGLWIIINSEEKRNKLLHLFLGGFILGMAFSTRFQTLLFIGGVGLALLFQKKWKETIYVAMGVLISILLIQGVVDLYIWGKPFAELKAYVIYNILNRNNYGHNNYLMYPEVLLGILIPPVSIFLTYGFCRTWKKYLVVFLPTFIFFAFHEYFPNKQERFILTIAPFIVVTGVVGWNEFISQSKYWVSKPGVLKNWYRFFWIFNFIILLFITTSYSKKSRVEAMLYLHPKCEKIQNILVDNNLGTDPEFVPQFYLGKWVNIFQYSPNYSYTDSSKVKYINTWQRLIGSMSYIAENPKYQPQYVLFYNDKDLDKRVDTLKRYFPKLKYETTIEPGNLDKLLYKLNPGGNRNQVIFIYKNEN